MYVIWNKSICTDKNWARIRGTVQTQDWSHIDVVMGSVYRVNRNLIPLSLVSDTASRKNVHAISGCLIIELTIYRRFICIWKQHFGFDLADFAEGLPNISNIATKYDWNRWNREAGIVKAAFIQKINANACNGIYIAWKGNCDYNVLSGYK